jgi:hypothetical protein
VIPIDEVVYFDVITSDPTNNGTVTDADSTPTFDVFEESTDTAILAAQNFTKRTSKTGDYRGTFTASAANGFEVGKWYSVIASATVGGVSGKCAALHFRCAPAENSAGIPKVDVVLSDGATVPSVATMADAVWDEVQSGHTTAGTFGKYLDSAVSGVSTGGLTAADIADAVLDELLSGHTGAGSLSKAISDVLAAVDTEIAAIKAKTDNLPASPAATGDAMTLTAGERTSTADAILKRDFSAVTGEASRSLLNAARFLRNKWTNTSNTLTVKKEDDSTTAWTATTTSAAGDPVNGVDPA